MLQFAFNPFLLLLLLQALHGVNRRILYILPESAGFLYCRKLLRFYEIPGKNSIFSKKKTYKLIRKSFVKCKFAPTPNAARKVLEEGKGQRKPTLLFPHKAENILESFFFRKKGNKIRDNKSVRSCGRKGCVHTFIHSCAYNSARSYARLASVMKRAHKENTQGARFFFLREKPGKWKKSALNYYYIEEYLCLLNMCESGVCVLSAKLATLFRATTETVASPNPLIPVAAAAAIASSCL